MFLFLLGLYSTGKGTVSNYIGLQVTFGFKPEGEYSLNFTSDINQIIVGLMTQQEYRTAALLTNYELDQCTDFNLAKNYTIFNFEDDPTSFQSFNGTVDTKGIYYLFYHGCNYSSFSIEYEYSFRNQGNIMDYRRQPLTIITPITFVIIVILFALWLVNWFLNFSVQIYLHYYFTSYFVLSFLTSLFYLIYIQVQKTNDREEITAIIYSLFDVLKDVAFLTVTQLAFNGWCYIVDTIKLKDLLFPMIIGALLAIFLLLYESLSMSIVWEVIVTILVVVLFILYAVRIFRAAQKVRLIVTAHMLVIRNAGIDPSTTPLHKKLQMYQSFEFAFIAYLLIILIRLVISNITTNYLWLSAFLEQVNNIVALVAFGIIFRIRNKDNDGYTSIGEGEREEFLLSDTEQAQ